MANQINYEEIKDNKAYFLDPVLFATKVLEVELFDYEADALRRYDERLNTTWYHEHHRPSNKNQDYLRNIYQEWNKFRNLVDGGNRQTELKTNMAYLMREPRVVIDALEE